MSFFPLDKAGRLARDLVRVLEEAHQAVPDELRSRAAVPTGGHGRGYGGRGGGYRGDYGSYPPRQQQGTASRTLDFGSSEGAPLDPVLAVHLVYS